MAKFKSLLYRELRISRKTVITQFLCMMSFSVFIAVGLNDLARDPHTEPIYLQFLMIMLNFLFSLIAVMFGIFDSNDLVPDIKSGWLKYSYTLPITPSERAMAISIRRIIVCFVGILFSLIIGAINYKISGVKYTSLQIVLCFIIYVCLMTSCIIRDFFIYSARTIEEIKKKSNTFGLPMIIVAGVIFFRLTISSNEEIMFNMIDIIKPIMLVWLIPLLILFIVIDYLVIKNRLSNPMSTALNPSQMKNDSAKKISLKSSKFHIKGNLYKELRQNRIILYIVAFIPYVAVFGIMLIEKIAGGMLEGDGKDIYYVYLAMSVFLVSGLLNNIFMNESKKNYGYFIIASPNGIKRHILYKYLMGVMIVALFTANTFVAGEMYRSFYYSVTNVEVKLYSYVFIIIALCMLISLAIDIPFFVRFGIKKGSTLKITMIIVLAIFLVLLFSYAPEKITDYILGKIVGIFEKIKEKDEDALKANAMMIGSIACVLLHVLSYKLSCSLFKKGMDALSE